MFAGCQSSGAHRFQRKNRPPSAGLFSLACELPYGLMRRWNSRGVRHHNCSLGWLSAMKIYKVVLSIACLYRRFLRHGLALPRDGPLHLGQTHHNTFNGDDRVCRRRRCYCRADSERDRANALFLVRVIIATLVAIYLLDGFGEPESCSPRTRLLYRMACPPRV
jgi:hypothetical protein